MGMRISKQIKQFSLCRVLKMVNKRNEEYPHYIKDQEETYIENILNK